MTAKGRRHYCLAILLGLGVFVFAAPVFAVRVAVVKSWSDDQPLPIIAELNNRWFAYGDIALVIDLSLQKVNSFTYADLAATNADVIWLSNPAGLFKTFADSEVNALKQYLSEGHSLFGTYRVFRFSNTNNSELAPLFGLPEVLYNANTTVSEQVFELLQPNHPLFENMSSPYLSTALARAQVPADGLEWQDNDLGFTTMLAKTPDNRGVVLLHQAADHHAIYISHFVEFVDPARNASDTQLVYNALTYQATPTGECCTFPGACQVVEEDQCDGVWTLGGSCNPNPCPQSGPCCFAGESCEMVLEANCPTGQWVNNATCQTDSDRDGVIEPCDACPGFDDARDDDHDGAPDACDRCPGFDDSLDKDGDTVPDGCDRCPRADDRLDADADGVPDGCDLCPDFPDSQDCDEDEVPNGCDSEPDCNTNGLPDNCDIDAQTSPDCDENDVPDECQPDTDGDRLIDPCDNCVGNNALLGQVCDSTVDADDCKSGVFDCAGGTLQCTDGPANDDVDSDGDGVYNCNDLCPGTPPGSLVFENGCRPTGACCFAVGACLNAVPLEDCEQIPNGEFLGHETACAVDNDNDGVAGCADQCPFDPQKSSPGQCGCGRADTDRDGDLTADCVDGCPLDPAKTAPGVCGCGVPDTDTDGDQTLNCLDGCPQDANKTEPGVCGCGVPDDDTDGDETLDCEDGCPLDPTKTKPGVCGCAFPDDDSDGDGVLDCEDGCPDDPNKTEPLECGCGVPDLDSDGDGTVDCRDGCPQDPNKTAPGICGCGAPDVDSDADTVFDCHDECPGTPPQSVVDEQGCLLQGACCFPNVCVDNAPSSTCLQISGVYQGNGTSCADNCRFPATGDFDGDRDVDRDDHAAFANCLSGPGVPYPDFDCFPLDFDGDGDVDLRDARAFQIGFGAE